MFAFVEPEDIIDAKNIKIETKPPVLKEKKFPKLPIEEIFPKLKSKISKRERLIILSAPTGTGKTIGIPYMLANETRKLGKPWRIRVALPTTIAAISAHNFISESTDVTVGYAAARKTVNVNSSTQIIYMTTGYLVGKIYNEIRKGNLKRYMTSSDEQTLKIFGNLLMIDEIHTATIDGSILMALLAWLYTDKDGVYQGPFLLFTSATFTTIDLDKYFSTSKISRIQMTVQGFKVKQNFIKEGNMLNKSSKEIEDEIFRIISREKKNFDKNLKAKTLIGVIFRPGIADVINTAKKIKNRFKNNDMIITTAYSGMTIEEENLVLKEIDHGIKIVVGTNIIESSITIKDVDFVISDMLENDAYIDEDGIENLIQKLITKSSAKQRAGRAGRTKPGRSYFLISEKEFKELPDFREREIDKTRIDLQILNMIGVGLHPASILKLDLKKYDNSIKYLRKNDLLTYENLLTDVGQTVSDLNLSINGGRFLYYLRELTTNYNTMNVGIGVAAFLETFSGSIFKKPNRLLFDTREYNRKLEEANERSNELLKGTDIDTLINMFLSFYNSNVKDTSLYYWTNKYSVNTKLFDAGWNLYEFIKGKMKKDMKTLQKGNDRFMVSNIKQAFQKASEDFKLTMHSIGNYKFKKITWKLNEDFRNANYDAKIVYSYKLIRIHHKRANIATFCMPEVVLSRVLTLRKVSPPPDKEENFSLEEESQRINLDETYDDNTGDVALEDLHNTTDEDDNLEEDIEM